MKFLVFLMLFFSFSSFAVENKLGAGAMIGNPTGVNAKYWLDGDRAVDGGMGFSFGRKTELSVHSDYLFHQKAVLFYNDVHPLDLYYGVGGRIEFSDGLEMGVRLPVGLTHFVEERNADLFAEVAPIVDFISKVGVELHFTLGARYYFE